MEKEIVNEVHTDYCGYKDIRITVDDMPNPLFKDIAVLCGVDVAIALLKNFAGNTIAVPQRGLKRVEMRIICEEYEKNYDAQCIRRLSRNLGRTEQNIRNILTCKYMFLKSPGQLPLFGDKTDDNTV